MDWREGTRGETNPPLPVDAFAPSLRPMICPACGNALATRKVGAVDVDVCDGGCGGVWFDNFELRKVSEEGGEVIRGVPRDLSLHVDRESKRACPRCEGQWMLRRYYSRLRRTQIDECPNCAGIWLDAGEFAAILAEVHENPLGDVASLALNQTVAALRGRSGM